MPDTIVLHPTAPLSERVLLTGDPGRALLLSQSLLSAPKMFNHNRGLWGYSGTGADGRPLTIQSTGLGGPSAAIVVGELHRLGARRLVQVGTCAAIASDLELGELVIVERALAADGTSRALGAGEVADPSPALRARLGGGRRCVVVSGDLLYEELDGAPPAWLAAGATVADMQAATLFTLAARRGFEAASVLIVAEALPSRRRIEPEELVAAEERAGALAADALR